jgi:hypothetical protein
MDYVDKYCILSKISEKIKKEKIEMQLLVAECINFAYIGSQPPVKQGQTPPGFRAYERWKKRKVREMYPEMKQATLWDMFEPKLKKKKSFKLN